MAGLLGRKLGILDEGAASALVAATIVPSRSVLRMIERCWFLELRTADLALAQEFWVRQLGLSIIEEDPGHFFAVDAGGLRLCIDTVEDPADTGDDSMMIGFSVKSIRATLRQLASRGLWPPEPLRSGSGGRYVRLHDPDGRLVILTEREEEQGP